MVSAVMMCPMCDWSAKMSGDTPNEVSTFLSSRLREHVNEQHPEVCNRPIELLHILRAPDKTQ